MWLLFSLALVEALERKLCMFWHGMSIVCMLEINAEICLCISDAQICYVFDDGFR